MIGKQMRMWLVVLSLLAGVAVAPAPASAQTTLSKSERVEFNKLVAQRNRLFVQLKRLDRQASDLMKQGREPVVVHAEQVSVQDQLDLVELRLAILATGNGLMIPPLPGSGDDAESDEATDDDPVVSRNTARAFARGRNRALEQLRREGRRFLKSIDFKAFLRQ